MKSFIIVLTICLIAISTNVFAAFPASATVANQAKVEILSGKIRVGDVFKIVLKTQSGASSDTASIGSYSTTGELSTGGGYTQGGYTLENCAVTLATSTANFTCTAATWTNTSALTFDAVEIYDSTCATNSCANANQVVALYPITSFTSASTGAFIVTLPAGAVSIALMDILRGNAQALLDIAVTGTGNVDLPPISVLGEAQSE